MHDFTYALSGAEEGITISLPERGGHTSLGGGCRDHPSELGHGVVQTLRITDGAGGSKVRVLGVARLCREWRGVAQVRTNNQTTA